MNTIASSKTVSCNISALIKDEKMISAMDNITTQQMCSDCHRYVSNATMFSLAGCKKNHLIYNREKKSVVAVTCNFYAPDPNEYRTQLESNVTSFRITADLLKKEIQDISQKIASEKKKLSKGSTQDKLNLLQFTLSPEDVSHGHRLPMLISLEEGKRKKLLEVETLIYDSLHKLGSIQEERNVPDKD